MKKIRNIVLVMALLIFITGCGSEENSMTSLTWTNNGSDTENLQLKVAVGADPDSYEGDILEAGTYVVEQINSNEEEKSTERIYNIYISDEEYSDFNDVMANVFVTTSVGGLQNDNESEITLEDGQFMYISLVTGGERGHLKIYKD